MNQIGLRNLQVWLTVSPLQQTLIQKRILQKTKINLCQSHCCANILVPAESDNRYHRVRGAIATLEQEPSSRNWLLAVKKDALTWCTFNSEKSMMSSTSKKYNNRRFFFLDNGWRLEFASNKDWKAFKALYKDCFGRNFAVRDAKAISIPGVRDASDYEETYSAPFHRPKVYISRKGDDELFRAVTWKSSANYDMDSEDEKWLSKFNNINKKNKESQ
ncbi:hypothetical protein JHK87_028637 [Glycine soja]|nr:hypothetical protein JHK87_028637 [Glycine soja]